MRRPATAVDWWLALCVGMGMVATLMSGSARAQPAGHDAPSAVPAQPPRHAADHVESEPTRPAEESPSHDQHAEHAPVPDQPVTPIPPVTEADRAAAFPDVESHAMHDNALHSFVLLDQLEWRRGVDRSAATWDSKGWIGRDLDRLWFRAEGASEDGRLGDAEAHLFYGRGFARWWDVLVGLRQDVRPGPAQSWLAVGIQGLAPYWFEVEATAYLGRGGQTAARLEAEYDLLLTNRLVLQPLVEANLYGKSNAERGIGAGISTFEAGFRLRYEFRREVAPYIGVTWNNAFGQTADFASSAGDTISGRRYLAGLRLWF